MKAEVRIGFSVCVLLLVSASGAVWQQPETAPASSEVRQLLVSAKSVAITARIGEVAEQGHWMWDANPARAKDKLEKALRAWGRFAMVQEPTDADLVLLIVEGNRSGALEKGKLFERLLVFRGGSAEIDLSKLLWQEEMESSLGGRPADKLVQDLRRYIEEMEKSGAAPSAQKTVPMRMASPLETFMLDRTKIEMPVPKAELLAARTVAVISYGPEPAKGAKAVLGGFLMRKDFSTREASAKAAKEEAAKQIRNWKRYSMVEDPATADLVIVIREWNQPGETGRGVVGAKLALIKGGPDVLQNPQLLWVKEEVPYVYGGATKLLIGEVGRELKKASTEAEKR